MPRATNGNSSLDPAELLRLLRGAEPAVVVASRWLVRRVVACDRDLGGLPLRVPHGRIHTIRRGRLLEIAGHENLPLPHDLPAGAGDDDAELTLLAAPDEDWLAATPRPAVLTRYWAMLFHARLDSHFRRLYGTRLTSPAAAGRSGQARRLNGLGASGELEPTAGPHGAAVRDRIDRLGRAVFNEARFVLVRERHLPPAADDAETYGEFAAVSLEFYHFARGRLAWYFPSVRDADAVLALLGEDVDAGAVLAETRPAGAARPSPAAQGDWDPAAGDESDEPPPLPPRRRRKGRGDGTDAKRRDALLAKAGDAEKVGNDVRAALLRMRAYRLAGAGGADVHAAARRDLGRLVDRLKAALGLDDATARQWRTGLGPLLASAAAGWWNPEGRLLYDLQKVCLDHEREIYSVNVVEWLLDWRNWGRRTLRRPLPRQRPVLAAKHLRTAARRVQRCRLGPVERARLQRLLGAAVDGAEARVREDLRPPVVRAFEEAGLQPRNAVERTARHKLVEELLDEVVGRGFFGMGNLRDAVSRNGMKLTDLAGPAEFLRGDQLLRIDRGLADSLAGVYRRGEVYLRAFQRLSSLLFATPGGRAVTRLVLIPFGGAFLILAGLEHTVGILVHKLAGVHLHLTHPLPLVVTGLFLFGVMNWPAFRAAAWRGAKAVGRVLHAAFVGLPRWAFTRPAVKAFLASRTARFLRRFALEPLLATGVAWLVLPREMAHGPRGAVLAGVFAGAAVLLNTPLGRFVEHAVLHGLRVFWSRLAVDLLADLFHWVMAFFGQVLERFERLLYEVDEWFRFRGGQGPRTLWVKAVFGTAWFFVAYAARFVTNLLIEPQINPVKHFPVVTVSHKIILPTEPLLARGLETVGLAAGTAHAIALPVVFVIPGAFGFFAWELKENWKLYRANRSHSLGPVQIGSHGESMARLLRPGFHSGTVPKIFARLRRLQRRAEAAGEHRHDAFDTRPARKAHKQLEALEHVREAVARFVERELVDLLDQDPAWAEAGVSVGEVRVGATRIEVELRARSVVVQAFQPARIDCVQAGKPALQVGGAPAWVSFEQRLGWVLAGVDEPGWTAGLPPAMAGSLASGLIGLYRLAGVDLVREHVDGLFAPRAVRWDVRGDCLVVWPDAAGDVEATYEMRPGTLAPRVTSGDGTTDLPTLDGRQLLLSLAPVEWAAWVRAWEPPGEAADGPRGFLPALRVLPAADAGANGGVPAAPAPAHP